MRGINRHAWALVLTIAMGNWALALAQPPQPDADWVYRIQPGDNLFGLTDAYLEDHTSWRELQRINKVSDPLKLQPGALLRMPIRLLRREASVATVVFTQGEASFLRPPASAATPLQAGTELRAGDRLRTGEAGSLSLRFVDGSRLLIAPGSEISIEQLLIYGRSGLPSVRLQLNKGSADSKVQKQPQRPADYEIRTPSLNLGVRGTEFRVQVADDGGNTTRAEVLEGIVAANKTLAVDAGFGVVAAPGQAAPQLARLPAAPDLSAVPPKLERLPLTINWAAQPGATAWRAQLFAAGDFERLLFDGRFNRPQAAWADVPDGSYTLRVRAIDALGLEGLASDRPFILKARPEPPFSRTPGADAVVYGEQLDLAWTRPLNALKFRLQLSTASDFSAPLLLDRSDVDASELRLTLPPGVYHFRLASIAKDNDLGPFGDMQTVTMRQIPPTPALAPPEIGDKALAFRWAAAPGAARYHLQWAADPEFKQVLAEPTVDEPALTLPRPSAGSYYLRVQSVDAQGHAGPYGGAQQVDIPRSRWLWLLPLGLLLLAI